MSLSHILLFFSLVACVWGQGRVLVFTATAGFRHDSIPTAIQSLKTQNITDMLMEFSEDSTLFTTDNLARYDVVMFLSTTGEILNPAQKAAFQQYLDSGGNFMGVHCATATLETDEFYKKEIGALFEYHPECTDAVVEVIDSSHPSTSMLPARWKVRDEMYNFASNPRDGGAIVVLAADESTYNDPGSKSPWQGSPHPLAWYQTHGGGVDSNGFAGRSFYTALGHLNESWQDPLFMQHIVGGLSWAADSGTTRATNASALVGNSSPAVGAVSTSATPSPIATTKPITSTSGSVKIAAHILTLAMLIATCEILISSLM